MILESSKKFSQIFATILVLLITFWAGSAASQSIIGNRNSPSVTVDLSVLEEIGSTPTVPQLVQPSVRKLLKPNSRPLLMPNSRHLTGSRLTRETKLLLAPSKHLRGMSLIRPAIPKNKTGTPAKPKGKVISPAESPVALPASPKLPPPAPKVTAAPQTTAPLPLTATRTPAETLTRPEQDAATMTKADANLSLKRGQVFSFDFANGSSEINKVAETRINGIAKSLQRDEKLRLQLLAYAGGKGQTLSQARRTSLSRGLAVRSLLMEKGILSTRIDVRALGNKSDSGPPNRVDMIITSR